MPSIEPPKHFSHPGPADSEATGKRGPVLELAGVEESLIPRGFHRNAFPFLMTRQPTPASPAPLQASEAPIHLRPVAMNDALVVVAEQFLDHLAAAGKPAGEEGKRRRHERPHPSLGLAFVGRRLVNVQGRLRGQLLGQFGVGWLDGSATDRTSSRKGAVNSLLWSLAKCLPIV